MNYILKLDHIFEAQSRRDFLKNMGRAVGAASHAGKIGSLMSNVDPIVSVTQTTNQAGQIFADWARRFGGLGVFVAHSLGQPALNDSLPNAVEILKSTGDFNVDDQVENILMYYFAMGNVVAYKGLKYSLYQRPPELPVDHLEPYELMLDAFEEQYSLIDSKQGSTAYDGYKSIAKLVRSEESSPKDVKEAFTKNLSEVKLLLEKLGIDYPDAALTKIASKYFNKYLSAFQIVFNPITKNYENNIQKTYQNAIKEKSKIEDLETYDVPKDYEYGEPMHQPFESKLSIVLDRILC